MAVPQYVFAELVRESCTASGTGVLALGGALPGHRRFADAVPVGAAFCYTVAGVTDPAQWECGIGQIDAQGRLVRSGVSASSNGNALVDFGAGLKTVALTVGAGWLSAVTQPPVVADVAGLQAALDGKLASSAVSAFGLTLTGSANAAAARTVLGLSSIVALADGKVGIGTTTPGHGLQVANGAVQVSGNSASVSLFLANAIRHSGTGGFFIDANSGGAAAGITLRDGSGFTQRLVIEAAGHIRGGSDNVVNLGTAPFRFAQVYSGTGTINTSDERDKVWRGAISAIERRAARAIVDELGFFQWSASVDAKGEAARMHCGARAQAVWAIMAAEGLVDPIGEDGRPGQTPYAFLCFDEWPADEASGQVAGWRYGLRTDQLALFLIGALLPRRRTTMVPA